jgi:hypothetical protein
MSFGFSIGKSKAAWVLARPFSRRAGDIVLLSKLAYDLYSSVTTGRKAASRDLQELEDVLFNLRCALDHLGDVAKDVVGRADSQPSGQELHQKLNRMMASCGTTLKELDGVTKKYRESILSSDETDKTKKRNLGDVTKRVKVNWKKVRWDQEKQSLQQYREKLRSHTDAINLVLNSILWSVCAILPYASRTNLIAYPGQTRTSQKPTVKSITRRHIHYSTRSLSIRIRIALYIRWYRRSI